MPTESAQLKTLRNQFKSENSNYEYWKAPERYDDKSSPWWYNYHKQPNREQGIGDDVPKDEYRGQNGLELLRKGQKEWVQAQEGKLIGILGQARAEEKRIITEEKAKYNEAHKSDGATAELVDKVLTTSGIDNWAYSLKYTMKDGTVFENDESNHPVNSKGYRMSFDTADLKYNADLALKDSTSGATDEFSKGFSDAGGGEKGIVAGLAAALGVVVAGGGYAVATGGTAAAPGAGAATAPEAIELADTIFNSMVDAGNSNLGFGEATTEFGATAEQRAANLETLADTISEEGVQYDSGLGGADANADGFANATELQTMNENLQTATQEFQAEVATQTSAEQSGMPPRINMTNKFYWSQHTKEEIQAIQNAFNDSLANPGDATPKDLWAQHSQAMGAINGFGSTASQSLTAKIAIAGSVLGLGTLGTGLGVGLTNKKNAEAEAEKSKEMALETGGKDYIGTSGNDTWAGTDKNDYAVGLHGNDTLSGLGGDDRLHGNEGNDTLSGGAGADRLFGEQGDDTLTGGVGADRFLFELKNAGVDHISDFQPGEDKIEFGGELAGLTFERLKITKLTDSSATTDDYSVTNADTGINMTVTTHDIQKGLEASDFIFT